MNDSLLGVCDCVVCRQTAMHYCAAQNFVEFLVDLAELGASIDTHDDRELTPLHLAATHGRTSAVAALLRRGADPNLASLSGDTSLHFSCQHGHSAVVSYGAESYSCTFYRSTLWHLVVLKPLVVVFVFFGYY